MDHIREGWHVITRTLKATDRRAALMVGAVALAVFILSTTLVLTLTGDGSNEAAFLPSRTNGEQTVDPGNDTDDTTTSVLPPAGEGQVPTPTTGAALGSPTTVLGPDGNVIQIPGVPTVPPSTAPSDDDGDNAPQASVPSAVLRVTASSGDVNPREWVNFSAANIPGSTRNIVWTYGDGTGSCNSLADRPAHAYKAPGTYAVRAIALNGPCGTRPSSGAAEGSTAVTVTNGATSSNGPALPTVDAQPGPGGNLPEDPHVRVQVSASDLDGYVSQIVVDWNDGSPPSVISFPLTECRDTPTTWPSSNENPVFDHDYMSAGTYNVSATVTTVGCDGATSQQAVDTLSVTAGGLAVGGGGTETED